MYFTIITVLKKLFKNKILIFKIKLFARGELFWNYKTLINKNEGFIYKLSENL